MRRLRVWRPSSGIITMIDQVAPSSEPGFRADARKALLGVLPDQLWEVDLESGAGRPLDTSGLESNTMTRPAYLADGRLLFCVSSKGKMVVHACSRDGDRLTPAFSAAVEAHYLVVGGRFVVLTSEVAIKVFECQADELEMVAELSAPDGLCELRFDGKLVHYSDDGAYEILGLG